MTKYLTPRSDSVSVKIIEPSDFEKFFTSDLVRDHKISGLTLSGGTGLTVHVALGEARLKGLHLESTAQETVSGLTASDVNYIYVKLARDGNGEAESWDFDKNISGTTPTDALFIGTATTNGTTVTSVDQTDVITTINNNDGYSDVYYGDGSDGDDVVISSSTTFGTIKQYNKSLTINSGVTITPTATENATVTILVNGTFTLNGAINMDGKGGKGGTQCGNGGKGGTAGSNKQDGNDAHQGEKGNKGLNCGGSGGPGGRGGNGGGGSGGAAGPGNGALATGNVSCELNLIKTKPNILSKSLPQFYGCGGSSGSGGGGGQGGSNVGTYGGAGGIGGAGGNGGGGVVIICRTFNNTGSITANGVIGGAGSAGSGGGGTVNGEDGGSGGKSGGGGGGEGGTIVIAYQTLTALGTVTATAGAGGSAGGGQGTATNGTAGSAGVVTQVSIT